MSNPATCVLEFNGHHLHVVFDDDPFTTEYFPAPHAIQSANSSFPDVSTYLPAGHPTHDVGDDDPFKKE